MPSSPRPASRMSWTVKGESKCQCLPNSPPSVYFNVICMARAGTYCFTTNSSWSMSSSPLRTAPARGDPRGSEGCSSVLRDVLSWRQRPTLYHSPTATKRLKDGRDLKTGEGLLYRKCCSSPPSCSSTHVAAFTVVALVVKSKVVQSNRFFGGCFCCFPKQ